MGTGEGRKRKTSMKAASLLKCLAAICNLLLAFIACFFMFNLVFSMGFVCQLPPSCRDGQTSRNTFTFHLHEVELVDGLQQRGAVQVQIKIRGHPRRQRPLPPLIFSQVNSPYKRIRDLAAQRPRRISGCCDQNPERGVCDGLPWLRLEGPG